MDFFLKLAFTLIGVGGFVMLVSICLDLILGFNDRAVNGVYAGVTSMMAGLLIVGSIALKQLWAA